MKKLYFLVLALLVSTITFGQELLVNGNFESWDDPNTPTGWTHVESVDQESTEIHGGTYAVKHTGGTSDLGQLITGITPGNSYTVSLWFKVEAGTGDGTDARIWSKWSNNGTVDHTTDADVLQGVGPGGYFDNNGNVWTQYTTTVTAPANANEFYFEVRTYGSAIVYWDDFSFFQESNPVPALSVTAPTNGATIASPDVNIELSVLNFVVGTPGAGIDGHIHYTVDGGSTVMKYDTDPIALTGLTDGEHTVDLELVDNTHTPLNPAVTASVTFTVASVQTVSDIASLRASAIDGFYQITGEVIVTFVTGNSRNQIFIEDATGGMLIDDNAGTITTMYNNGDGITGLEGQLGEFANVLQFVPSTDPGAASSTGNSITPQVVTINDLTNNLDSYESELVTINDVTFVDGDGVATFASSTDYDITDASGGPLAFRTNYPNDNMAGELIPNAPTTITVIAGEYFGTYQVYPREPSEILSVENINSNNVSFNLYPNPTNTGYVTIASAKNSAIAVEVYNILGKQVLNSTLTNNNLNVSALAAGMYILKISQDGASTTKKLVIK